MNFLVKLYRKKLFNWIDVAFISTSVVVAYKAWNPDIEKEKEWAEYEENF